VVTPVLPALAAAACSGRLVARPRGRVVHLATPTSRQVTARGALRRGRNGCRPLCGSRGRAWPAAPAGDPRGLCVRCSSALRRRGIDVHDQAVTARAAAQLTEQQLLDAIEGARDGAQLHAAVMTLLAAGATHHGIVGRHSRLVRDARYRLGLLSHEERRKGRLLSPSASQVYGRRAVGAL
jgi:hypothetical protein